MKRNQSQMNANGEQIRKDGGLADLDALNPDEIKGGPLHLLAANTYQGTTTVNNGPRTLDGFVVTFDRPIDPH